MARNGLPNGSSSIQTVTCASDFGQDIVKPLHCPHGTSEAVELVMSEKEKNRTENDPNAFRPLDGGWGWVVCLASFWTNGTLFGVMNCFGVLYVNLEKKFAETHQDAAFLTSWVGSVSIGMTFLFSPVASILTDKYGIQRIAFIGGFMATAGMLLSSFVNKVEILYLTYGVIMGTGASLAYTPSLVILGHYFQDRIGLVNGIVTAGSSVFTMVMPLLLKHLLKVIGLKHTLQVLAAMMAMVMVCALTFRPQLPTPSNTPSGRYSSLTPEKRDKEDSNCCKQFFGSFLSVDIWKNKRYVLWVFAIPMALFGYFVPYVHLIKHVQIILPESNGEILVTCIGLTSGIGRIIFGKIADFKRVNRIHLQQISFLSIGILTMLLVVAKQFPVLIIMCLFLGLFDGCFISLLGPIAFDIVGNEGASQAIGFLLGFCSIPLTVGPPIAGFMFDHLGNYTAAFLAAGAPPIIGAALMCLIHKISFDVCPHYHPDHDHHHHHHHHLHHHPDILVHNGSSKERITEDALPEEKQKLVASLNTKELKILQPSTEENKLERQSTTTNDIRTSPSKDDYQSRNSNVILEDVIWEKRPSATLTNGTFFRNVKNIAPIYASNNCKDRDKRPYTFGGVGSGGSGHKSGRPEAGICLLERESSV